jgi:hypothetical protein
MTPRELTIAQLGHGPSDVSQVAGLLMAHGHGYPEASRLAKESLAALVVEKRAEVIRAGAADVYRLPASTPVEKSTEPSQKLKGKKQ